MNKKKFIHITKNLTSTSKSSLMCINHCLKIVFSGHDICPYPLQFQTLQILLAWHDTASVSSYVGTQSTAGGGSKTTTHSPL